MEQWRVEFDAEVAFANGGGLSARGFRLDIPGTDIGDAELGELFVRHLGLLMVGEVRVTNKRLLREAHKGSRGVATGPASGRVVDLSHPITHGMTTYPGLPGPEIGAYRSHQETEAAYGPGTSFLFGRITMVAQTGTYLDAPLHRFPEGPDLPDLDLARTVDLDGVLVRVTGSAGRAIGRETFLPYEVRGRAVIVHTGHSRHWGTEAYGQGHPFLTGDAAEWLVDNGAALVGIDSLNVDDNADPLRPVHTGLLDAGVPIVEHLCGLEALPPQGFRFHAAPLAMAGMGTSPVRAYAVVQSAGSSS